MVAVEFEMGVGRREAKLAGRLRVIAEGAGDRHQAIAAQPFGLARRRVLPRCGDGMAANPGGQGQLSAVIVVAAAMGGRPVLVEHVAMAQILDAGTARLAQAGEGGQVRAQFEGIVEPLSGTLERRAVML